MEKFAGSGEMWPREQYGGTNHPTQTRYISLCAYVRLCVRASRTNLIDYVRTNLF
jgi:hypothetical protein